jgi:ribosomal protein S18 acetylase RimI-like enzyme
MHSELSTSVQVRDAKPEDVFQLVSLINALNVHEGIAPSMTEQHATFVLFSPQRPVELHCVVATMPRSIVGFALYYRGYDTASTSFGFHLADIFIENGLRKQGVGRIIMGEIARRCLDSGGQWCSLTVAAQNNAAHAFYDALGLHLPDVTFRSIGAKSLGLLCAAHSSAQG